MTAFLKYFFELRPIVVMALVLSCVFFCKEALSLTAGARLDKVRDVEPVFDEIVREVFRAEKMEWADIADWKKRLKKAPWLPTLYLGYDHLLKETNTVSISDNISVTGDGVTVGPNENDFDQVVNNGSNIHFKAVWQLGDLVFHPSTFQARREVNEMMKNRLSLRDYLFKVYSERRKLQVEYYAKGRRVGNGLLWEQIQVLTEKLDSLTNGVFGNRWAGKGF